MDPMIVQGMSYTAAGGSLVAMVVWFVWSLLRRSGKRANSEGALDDRAVLLVKTVQETSDKLIEELRATVASQDAKIGKLHEELFTAYKRFGEFVAQQQQVISAEVSKVRDVHDKAMERVHKRLDDCELQHGRCREEQQGTRGEVVALRQMVAVMHPSVNVNVDQMHKTLPVPA